MKRLLSIALALAVCAGAFAENSASADVKDSKIDSTANATASQGAPSKKEKKQRYNPFNPPKDGHFKLYGFIRNYFTFDSRESTAGTADLYYYMPKDVSLMEDGNDANAVTSFRFLSLTSRLGLDVMGYEAGGYKFGAKIEGDFYAGLTGTTGTALFRLRLAYATVEKKTRKWLIGQDWHPMAADLPDIFSLESGVPFNPFSRTPQIRFEWKFADMFSLSAAALCQMQYTCTGPEFTAVDGKYGYVAVASTNYIKYGLTPEFYLGLNIKNDNNVFKIGADILSIKPREYDYDLTNGKKKCTVNDRLTTWNLFVYGQSKMGNWIGKSKLTYAHDGSHLNMIGGYGVTGIHEDGSWSYCPTSNVSIWADVTRKAKNCRWVPTLFLGYSKIFGLEDPLVKIEGATLSTNANFWAKNNGGSVNQIWRVQPEVTYNIGKFIIGLEYMYTGVEYGKGNTYKEVTENLHCVHNHRVQIMMRFNF